MWSIVVLILALALPTLTPAAETGSQPGSASPAVQQQEQPQERSTAGKYLITPRYKIAPGFVAVGPLNLGDLPRLSTQERAIPTLCAADTYPEFPCWGCDFTVSPPVCCFRCCSVIFQECDLGPGGCECRDIGLRSPQ